MAAYRIQEFPKSRLATIDILEVGRRKHHIAGLIELDVSGIREKIRERNRAGSDKISFTAWLISVISVTVKNHETSCSFLKGRNKLMIFDDINGWFIPISVHPLCFGIGSIIRQPGVVDGEIGVRDVLKMTILMDHDVIDGAQMARFISSLSENIESGMNLSENIENGMNL